MKLKNSYFYRNGLILNEKRVKQIARKIEQYKTEGAKSISLCIDDEKLYYRLKKGNQDIIEDIHTGENGEELNRLVSRDGKVFVETATCPDGICVSHRAIFRNGESIICLPHSVVITVTTKTDYAPDIVV